MIYHHQLQKYLTLFSIAVILGTDLAITQKTSPVFAQTVVNSSVSKSVTFTCNDSEATIKAKNGPKVLSGQTTIYIGYQQVSSSNKDPRIVRFDNGIKKWCRSDYETTNDDGTGYGLFWDGKGVLYGVFTSTGTQTGNDFRRFANGRWLTSYGSGGGAKVAVIAKINPDNGSVYYATFLSARKPSDGKTNSLVVTGLSWNGVNLSVNADSWWTPRRADKNSMTCSGSSPYKYAAAFTGDLSKVSAASAATCY
ncbi:hypothetical protein I8751_13715 [Nostocaceae cyanobacterium CENA357]|uniref:Uncharacterized protein n=1 Tax=Atlanticothrix silvestris CENA357 TaxID=1725252 RepID=A0A8J7HJ34_9CYAN|nr:hypothetical protein [Atlanticothrix silvestris]MBH8553413.1 hypothetical protein [Atlanticothrix silvestris CENA357]